MSSSANDAVPKNVKTQVIGGSDAASASASGDAIALRAPYARPALRVFGAVTDLTMGFGGTRSELFIFLRPSDRRLKENIVHVADHPAGFGLYLFDFRPEYRDAFGHDRQFGVMADEVAQVAPGFVTRGADGFLRVDYAQIGVVPTA